MINAEMMSEADSNKWALIGSAVFCTLAYFDNIYRFFKRLLGFKKSSSR